MMDARNKRHALMQLQEQLMQAEWEMFNNDLTEEEPALFSTIDVILTVVTQKLKELECGDEDLDNVVFVDFEGKNKTSPPSTT